LTVIKLVAHNRSLLTEGAELAQGAVKSQENKSNEQ